MPLIARRPTSEMLEKLVEQELQNKFGHTPTQLDFARNTELLSYVRPA